MADNSSNKVIIFGLENDASVFTHSSWADYSTFGLLQLPKTLIKFFRNEPVILRNKTCHNYSLEALQNNTVHLSHPTAFNDPFDGTLMISFEAYCKRLGKDFEKEFGLTIPDGLSTEKIIEAIHTNIENSQSLKEFTNQIHQWHHEEMHKLQNMGVCCFTDPEMLSKNLMWSHYANDHQGFCIEYQLPEHPVLQDEDWITGLKPWERSMLMHTFPVAYCEKRLDFSQKWPEMDSIIRNSSDYSDVFPYYQYGLITKGIEWSYEREWRFIYPPVIEATKDKYPLTSRLKDGDNLEFFPIKNVYLGCRMSKDVKDAIREIIGGRDIHIYDVYPSEDDYDFEFKEIN